MPREGCLIYYAENLDAIERDDLKDLSTVEATWLDVTVCSQKILRGVAYRQPSDIDDVGWAWEYLNKKKIGIHITTRKAKIRSDSLPWMDRATRREMNLRYRLLNLTPTMLKCWENIESKGIMQPYVERSRVLEGKLEQDACAGDIWKTLATQS